MKGKGVYAGDRIGGGQLEGVTKGASPIDFAAEFAKLRALSTELAKTAGGAPTVDGRTITFTGTGTTNVFTVAADTLQQAGEIQLKVPAGATTIVNVTGGSYDQTKAPTSGFLIWDHAKQKYVLDDKLQSADGGAERARLLWNFPTATKVVKNSGNAWPGSILSPNAAFDLGKGGPVNGSVWTKSLTGSGGAETHHYPFAGCLPGTTVPPTTPATGSPSPSGSASTPAGTQSPTPSGSASPSASTPASGAPSPSASGSAPAGGTGGSGGSGGSHGGGLAFTGADGIVPLTVGGALVLAAGGGIVYAARRKKANASS